MALRFLPGSGAGPQLETLRRAGLPTSWSELNGWYAEVPASNNAALLVTEAIKAHVTAPGALVGLRTPPAGERISAELAGTLADYIEENEETLAKLHRAAQLSEARYPLDLSQGATLLLPHLAQIKGLALLLRYEAIHYSSLGDRDRAFRSVTSGFALCRSLRHEPILISELVRIACVAITAESLEYLLSAQTLPDEQLQVLSALTEQAEADGSEASFRAIVGERAGAIPYFTAPSAELQQAIGGQLGFGAIPKLGTVALGAHRLLGLRDRDLREYLRFMGEYAEAATNGFPDAFRLSQRTQTEADRRLSRGLGRFALISRLVLPAIGKVITKEAAIATRLRCAHAAIAVERFRVAHAGALPNSLEELVPGFLREIPRDPVEGQPLRVTPQSTGGCLISSPGAGTQLQNQRTATFILAR